ncbi:MAG: hypothetical protein ACJ74F_02035 [Mycobacterium sp.]|jgi:hypothetical protein|uniref:hypothetical protein n=1 Tax=Mycobacterium sp. TaxID=1785 RepID=UPI00389AC47F
MAPQYIDPAQAPNVVMTAGSANDSSTSPLGNGMHGETAPPLAPNALPRSESDGDAGQ